MADVVEMPTKTNEDESSNGHENGQDRGDDRNGRSESDGRRERSRSRSRSRERGDRSRGDDDAAPKRQTGTACRWSNRGFGFITPDSGADGGDVFCHVTEIKDGNALKEGTKVEYEVQFDERKGKLRAINVTGGITIEDRGPPPRRDYGRRDYDRRDSGRRDYDRRDYGRRDYGRRDYDRRDNDRRDYDRRDYDRRDDAPRERTYSRDQDRGYDDRRGGDDSRGYDAGRQ